MTSVDDDDEVDELKGLYEGGHWEWNETAGGLVFKSDAAYDIPAIVTKLVPAVTVIGNVEFNDVLNPIEEQKFRKRFQRKWITDDVVTLQDVKDLVLYTAPKAMITIALVNVLHLSTTERFLRAVITYCQYYLQISNAISERTVELETKIQTPKSKQIEMEFKQNLQDLRLLVAKEYCHIILGAGNFARYHHMGPSKKTSQQKTEACLIESLLRITTQVVWLALGRKSYDQIALEIYRLFKSDIFNTVKHRINKKHKELDPMASSTLYGDCLKQAHMTNAHSPLMAELTCDRDIDYRLLGLGVMKNERALNTRLTYLEDLLVLPEAQITDAGLSIGILGLPRCQFDTMLKKLNRIDTGALGAASTNKIKHSQSSKMISVGPSSVSLKSTWVPSILYNDIYLPRKEEILDIISEDFPINSVPKKPCDKEQYRKWLGYGRRLVSKRRHVFMHH